MTVDIRQMTGHDQACFALALAHLLETGALGWGEVVRVIRAGYLRMSRERFAKLVDVSVPALAQIEADTGNPTLQTLQRLVAPVGLQVGLVPVPRYGARRRGIVVDEALLGAWTPRIRAAIDKNQRVRTHKPQNAAATRAGVAPGPSTK